MDVALVGCGHMGRHHARVIHRHPECRLVAAIDLVPERAREIAETSGAEVHTTVPDGVDAVVVATPTMTHADIASRELATGRWCLVEKPLAAASSLAAALRSPRLVVGHVERFNPAVRAVGALRPRFIETRRMAPPSGRSGDVDVIFDLMVHDLDLVLHWSSGEVEWLDAVGVAVDGPLVDTASVRLRTTDGIVANLVASRVAAAPERIVRVFERGRVSLMDLRDGRAFRGGIALPNSDGRDALTAQWDAFVEAATGRSPPAVGFDAGFGAIALAERIGRAISAA